MLAKITALVRGGTKQATTHEDSGKQATTTHQDSRTLVALTGVDDFVREAEAAAHRSPEDFHTAVDRVLFDLPTLDADPTSAAYRDHQMALYTRIAGKPYVEANEAHAFDVAALTKRPYPYNTGSAAEVATQLIGIGAMLRASNLAPQSAILEMGIGWGNTAFHLTRMGHCVVGLDIEPKYSAIVREQAQIAGNPIDLRIGSFYAIEQFAERFDAVLFYESFHHAHDHTRLLDAIPRVLRPGGKLILAGEPIDEALPYPWGVNWSGIAIYTIRKHGWLELCYRESYLLSVLAARGWDVVKHPCPMTAAGLTYVATRSS